MVTLYFATMAGTSCNIKPAVSQSEVTFHNEVSCDSVLHEVAYH